MVTKENVNTARQQWRWGWRRRKREGKWREEWQVQASFGWMKAIGGTWTWRMQSMITWDPELCRSERRTTKDCSSPTFSGRIQAEASTIESARRLVWRRRSSERRGAGCGRQEGWGHPVSLCEKQHTEREWERRRMKRKKCQRRVMWILGTLRKHVPPTSTFEVFVCDEIGYVGQRIVQRRVQNGYLHENRMQTTRSPSPREHRRSS